MLSDNKTFIQPGDIIKLSRFDDTFWQVQNGWYAWGGNRPVCGWYVVSKDDCKVIKPLQLPDLDDIILIER